MKISFLRTALAGLILSTLATSAANAGCVLSADQIEAVATKIKWRNDTGEENNSAVIRADITGTSTRGKSGQIIDYEAIIRPDKDDVFHIIPLPLFMVQLEKSSDSIYVCAHVDTANEANTEMIFYFLRYGQIRPVTPMPLPISQLGKILLGPLENTPLMVANVPIKIFARAQRIIMHLFSDITKIGVDRVYVNANEIVLLAGGDLSKFDGMAVRGRIPLKDKAPKKRNLP